jgi:hypothetical protein
VRGLALAEWLLAKLLSRFGRVTIELLLKRDLALPVPAIGARIPVTIRLAREADLDAITRLYAADAYIYLGDDPRDGKDDPVEPAARQQYDDRLKRGELCFLALGGSEIAHANWLCSSWAEAVPGHPLYLRTGEIYTTDAITAENFRGKNIHAQVLAAMLRHAQGAGYREAFTVTRVSRGASFPAFHQIGWRVFGIGLCFVARRSAAVRLIRLYGRIDPLLRSPAVPGG